ncbi:hypothetical protein [Nocardioides furvisabuli]|uniref:hypothetical protein n=1 Tax=Nocardioides furvisabuli TaxID=375542 RepID=UPI001E5C0F7D|nr:hypothetical protein [Nocardioides furvisabuli]
MTTPVSLATRTRRSRPRRTGRVAAVSSVLLSAAVLAAPAHADVPEGWAGQDEVNNLDFLGALALYAGAPLLLFVLIGLAVYLPAMVRGEKLLPDHSGGEAQWIGGPRQGVAELPAPDGDGSRAGGASGSW